MSWSVCFECQYHQNEVVEAGFVNETKMTFFHVIECCVVAGFDTQVGHYKWSTIKECFVNLVLYMTFVTYRIKIFLIMFE